MSRLISLYISTHSRLTESVVKSTEANAVYGVLSDSFSSPQTSYKASHNLTEARYELPVYTLSRGWQNN